MPTPNLYTIQTPPQNQELETTLLSHPNAKIKKIISPPHFKSEIFHQDKDEWVSLIQGEATLQLASTIHSLKAGDCIFIPANTPHQIINTSNHPLATWLGIYMN
jgi:cupin 2 domain-containing protein